jgi:hypothetical protein
MANDIVVAGQDTVLIIEGTQNVAIPLSKYKPTLPQ